MPYLSNLRLQWVQICKYAKVLPSNIRDVLTPLALARRIMGDGPFDGLQGMGRVTLHTNSFTLAEVELLRTVLLEKSFWSSNYTEIRPTI